MFFINSYFSIEINLLNYLIKNDLDNLKRRIEEMNSYNFLSEKIEKIDCVGKTIRFLTNLGRLLGTIYLQNFQLNFLGKWKANFHYRKNDCVYFEKNIFICVCNHKSFNLNFDCNNWQVFFLTEV